MKRNWMAMLVIAGGFGSAMFGQQYPQQDPQRYPADQGAPNYNGQYGNGQYDNGEYAGDPTYNGSYPGVYAPAPPPVPGYAYRRPPVPGPGYYWVDGYWNFVGGRYSWVGGYWMLPPYTGGYWVPPRYSAGRFFLGFWGGARRGFDRGFVRNDYRYQGRREAPRQSYGNPAQRGSGFRGGDNRGDRSGNHGQRGGRR